MINELISNIRLAKKIAIYLDSILQIRHRSIFVDRPASENHVVKSTLNYQLLLSIGKMCRKKLNSRDESINSRNAKALANIISINVSVNLRRFVKPRSALEKITSLHQPSIISLSFIEIGSESIDLISVKACICAACMHYASACGATMNERQFHLRMP